MLWQHQRPLRSHVRPWEDLGSVAVARWNRPHAPDGIVVSLSSETYSGTILTAKWSLPSVVALCVPK
jgi:hypothetical protein